MTTPLPDEICDWIIRTIGYGNHCMYYGRIADLKVDQLKKVLTALKDLPFVCDHPSGRPRNFSGARKHILVDKINSYFYTDESCTTVNPEAVQALAAATLLLPPNPAPPAHVAAAAPSYASVTAGAATSTMQSPAFASAVRQANAAMPNMHHSMSHAAESKATPGAMASPNSRKRTSFDLTTDGAAFSVPRSRQKSPKRRHVHGRLDYDAVGAAANHHQDQMAFANSFSNNSFHAAAAAPGTAPVYVKTEYALPDEVPHNDQERHLLGQLQGMGFSDTFEVLTSIRKLVAKQQEQQRQAPPRKHPVFAKVPATQQMHVSVDSVMIDIITTREELDEAKKMDEARRQSEVSRKEDARKRRRAIEDEQLKQLQSGSLDVWRTDPAMFASSWILNHDATRQVLSTVATNSDAKMKLIELLQLEKRSMKWFRDLPRAYFVDCVVPRICGESAKADAAAATGVSKNSAAAALNAAATISPSYAWLTEVIESLQDVMFNLKEQNKNGVPLAFLKAHDAWTLQHPADVTNVDDNSDDDDCVIVVDGPATATKIVTFATGAAAAFTTNAPNPPTSGAKLSALDVIRTMKPPPTFAKKVPEIIEIL
ncbi:hypothetical protein MPSEU_000581100 [Mayamaea pseudoterrestris]|nr:hypothetical protein MPSEU_000581100 [Mayamaea pseudoterrestris]